MAGAASVTELRSVPFILGASLAYTATNILLVSGIVALAAGLPLRLTLIRGHRHTWPAVLGVLFVGVLIAVLWSVSAWTIALAAIPLTALYYTLRNTVSLETNTVDALFQLADILDARDAYTHGHSLRVGQYAEKVALALGIAGDDAHLIFLAGRLHDIGKCAIRNEVLLKPGALDDEDRAHNGKGYPDGLSGDNIPLGARIIAVADAFDAMTTTRPYRKALPVAEAHRRLAEGAGTQWDPRVISVFLELLENTTLGQQEPLALPTATHATAPAEPTSAAA
jgi:HD-GYP domain-containing protein (c-di-GMP phosphodiesterase class II)